jgi:hypothetical protein
VPNVQWKTPDDGQRNCPKHVEFFDKNKFGKSARLLVLLKRSNGGGFSSQDETTFSPPNRGNIKDPYTLNKLKTVH